MRPNEENCGAGREPRASLPASCKQAETTDDDSSADTEHNSSKRSKGQQGKPVSQAHQISAGKNTRNLETTRSLEEAMKGLIISQMRGSYVKVEEGLLNLLKQCLTADQRLFSSAAVSGHVDHFESVDGEDLGWGCGWRNIQMLCSFLQAEDGAAREALFNGAGFVPDIPALQRWLEIAWNKGFDEAGAEYFDWSISGTRKWIGTTECAALLRSFGLRANIVSFTDLGRKRTRSRLGEKSLSASDLTDIEDKGRSEIHNEGMEKCHPQTDISNSRGGAVDWDENGKPSLYGSKYRGIVNMGLGNCDFTQDELETGDKDRVGEARGKKETQANGEFESRFDTEHTDNGHPNRQEKRHESLRRDSECDKFSPAVKVQWDFECDGCGCSPRGRRYTSMTRKDFNICSNCLAEVHKYPKGERGLYEDYVIKEEGPPSRTTGPPCTGENGKDEQGTVDDHGVDKGQKSMDKKVRGKEVHLLHSIKELGGIVGGIFHTKPLANEERGKAGMEPHSGAAAENHINHYHLIEWVWKYFTDKCVPTGTTDTDTLIVSKKSPLYFQHRGHSQTIVGIHRQRKPTGVSEDVHFLVLDPSVSTERLVKTLKEKSGWEKLIKKNVHTLKETDYQLCYADSGVAVGDELTQLKVLSSLRYSYHSK